MGEMIAINGNYSDFRIVKTRSVGQAVIEFPLERAEDFIRMFGLPKPGEEIPVALARLHSSPPAAPAVVPSEAPGRDAARERGRERYLMADDGERAVIRASVLCRDPAFRRWIDCADTVAAAAAAMREELGIESRAHIASNEDAYSRFIALETSFKQDSGLVAEVRG